MEQRRTTNAAVRGSPFGVLGFCLLFLDGALAGGALVRRRFVRRLQHDEPCSEDLTTALVEVNDGVMFVDFDERTRPVGGLTHAIAFRPVFHRLPMLAHAPT